MDPETPGHAPHAMHCMEIRGGSQSVEEALQTPGLDAWVYSRPFEGDDHGGDLHYLSLCGGGLTTRLLVADVSGHGARVADFSETLRSLMRKHINRKNQTKLVETLNREFGAAAQLQRFATAVIATYLANRRTLTVCNAGHPNPLWYRASAADWSLLETTSADPGNLPLGLDDDSPYHQFTVRLEPGDVVLFYTDALTESADGEGQLLGEDGLLRLARALDPADHAGLGPRLIAAIEQWRGGRPADDDVTLVVLSHNGRGPRRMSVGEKLDVYAKVFRLKDY